MMDFSEMLGSAGVPLSAVMASVGYLYKQSFERRRTTRVTLYYLLEMYHRMSKWTYALSSFNEDYLREVDNYLVKKGLRLQVAERDQIKTVLLTTIKAELQSQLEELLKDFGEPYLASLALLAKDDPFLAFELKGKESMLDIVVPLDRFFRNAGEWDVLTKDQSARLAKEALDQQVRGVALEEMRLAVRKTAWRAGFTLWLKCVWSMRNNSQSGLPLNIQDFIAPLLDRIPFQTAVDRPMDAVAASQSDAMNQKSL